VEIRVNSWRQSLFFNLFNGNDFVIENKYSNIIIKRNELRIQSAIKQIAYNLISFAYNQN